VYILTLWKSLYMTHKLDCTVDQDVPKVKLPDSFYWKYAILNLNKLWNCLWYTRRCPFTKLYYESVWLKTGITQQLQHLLWYSSFIPADAPLKQQCRLTITPHSVKPWKTTIWKFLLSKTFHNFESVMSFVSVWPVKILAKWWVGLICGDVVARAGIYFVQPSICCCYHGAWDSLWALCLKILLAKN